MGSRAQNILPQGLKSETARTFTAGVVFSSPFESAALRRFTTSVDYYHINIDNYLNTQPPITSSLPVGTPSAHATSGAGTTNASVYDVLGRAFYLAAKLRF